MEKPKILIMDCSIYKTTLEIMGNMIKTWFKYLLIFLIVRFKGPLKVKLILKKCTGSSRQICQIACFIRITIQLDNIKINKIYILSKISINSSHIKPKCSNNLIKIYSHNCQCNNQMPEKFRLIYFQRIHKIKILMH